MTEIPCHTFPQGTGMHRALTDYRQEEKFSEYSTFRKLYFLKDTTSSIHKIPGITLCISLRSFLASCQWRPRFQQIVWAVPHWPFSLTPAGQKCKAHVTVPMAQLCPPQVVFPYQGNEGHTHNSQFTTSTCMWWLFKHSQNQSQVP